MSYIPDCRNDEAYNQKYLNQRDKDEIFGYDWCTEMVVDMFFDNLELIDNDYVVHLLETELPEYEREEYDWIPTIDKDREPEKREVRTIADLIRSTLLDYIESSRDEVITSMIDNMDDDEYEANKARVDEEGEAE